MGTIDWCGVAKDMRLELADRFAEGKPTSYVLGVWLEQWLCDHDRHLWRLDRPFPLLDLEHVEWCDTTDHGLAARFELHDSDNPGFKRIGWLLSDDHGEDAVTPRWSEDLEPIEPSDA